MLDTLKRGVSAGYLIGLSVYIYGSCENKIIGAFLFGLGLLTICTFKLNLFTGKIGEGKFGECLLIFAANTLGIFITVYLLKWPPRYISAGVACGTLMQMGVALYSKHPWATVMCVVAFLLSGANHCIAMLYNAEFNSVDWWRIFSLAVIGNIVGAKLIAFGGVVKEVK